MIDENVYTITNDKPDELYGTYINYCKRKKTTRKN